MRLVKCVVSMITSDGVSRLVSERVPVMVAPFGPKKIFEYCDLKFRLQQFECFSARLPNL